jgi:hypothetical protein
MARFAQLDAPITSDGAILASYDSPMEGNRPITAPPGPPPPWPPYYPPAQPARRWLPVAIIVAAIIIATAVISAVLLSRGPDTATPAGPAPTAPGNAPTQNVAATSSTCKAWQATKPALDAIPALPAGWDWDTPNIGTYIANRNAAITKALDLFEPKIADTPPDVASVARNYVAVKRDEVRMLADKSFTSADAVMVNAASAELNQICATS